MTDREAFEAWWVSQWPDKELGLAALKNGDGGYVRRDWKVWQASRQQMAEEAAALADRQKEIGGRNEDHSWEICAAQLAYAIRSLATPTEGKT